MPDPPPDDLDQLIAAQLATDPRFAAAFNGPDLDSIINRLIEYAGNGCTNRCGRRGHDHSPAAQHAHWLVPVGIVYDALVQQGLAFSPGGHEREELRVVVASLEHPDEPSRWPISRDDVPAVHRLYPPDRYTVRFERRSVYLWPANDPDVHSAWRGVELTTDWVEDPPPTLTRGPTAAAAFVSQYTVSLLAEDDVNYRSYLITVEYGGDGRWQVKHQGFVLTVNGTYWEYGAVVPVMGSDRYWFTDRAAALATAMRACPNVAVNGRTAVQARALYDRRTATNTNDNLTKGT